MPKPNPTQCHYYTTVTYSMHYQYILDLCQVPAGGCTIFAVRLTRPSTATRPPYPSGTELCSQNQPEQGGERIYPAHRITPGREGFSAFLHCEGVILFRTEAIRKQTNKQTIILTRLYPNISFPIYIFYHNLYFTHINFLTNSKSSDFK